MLHGFFFVFCRCHCYCFCRIHCFVLCLCAFFRCSSFLSSFQFHLFTLYSVLSLHLSLSLYLATNTWFLRFVFSLKCFWTFYVSGCFVYARTMHIHIFHNAETNRRNILYEAEKRLNSCNTEQYMEYRDSPLKNNTTWVDFPASPATLISIPLTWSLDVWFLKNWNESTPIDLPRNRKAAHSFFNINILGIFICRSIFAALAPCFSWHIS